MAYEKQTWVCGETITADKLNHIEDGIADCCGGGGGDLLVVNITAYSANCGDTPVITADKTQEEIVQAFNDNKLIAFRTKVWCSNNPYTVFCSIADASENPGWQPSFIAYSHSGANTTLSSTGEWGFSWN